MINCISYEDRNKKLNELIMLLGKNQPLSFCFCTDIGLPKNSLHDIVVELRIATTKKSSGIKIYTSLYNV